MRHDSDKILRSVWKYLLKLLFICLLLGILYYSFKDSMGDMVTELSKVSPQIILVLFLSVVVYHLCEGHITWLIVHKTHPEYPRRKGFCNAFYCSFYKTATLGSGSGIAGIYYLNKAGIPVITPNTRANGGEVIGTADRTGNYVVTAVNKEDGLIEIDATAVILAMGCRERPRGALNIAGTRCAGVLSAGTAQKYVNIDGYMPGKEVVILGSGDIGLIMARRMTLEGAHVKMVCELMPYSSGLTRNIVQCLNDFDIPLKLSTTVIDIHGKERLEGVTIAKVDENRRPIPGTEEYVPCDTLMLSVGLIPENELSKNMGIEFDRVTGGPVVDEYRETTHPGVFACGNVLHVHDLVDFVTLESQTAGEGAARYIKNGGNKEKKYVKTRGINGVRYIVPQKIALGEDEDVKLFFRVGDVHKNAKVVVTYNGETLISKKRPRLAPGEMENVIIKSDMLKNFDENGIIEIQVEE